MKDKDQHLLWEAYLEKHTPDHKDEDAKDKKKGKYDDGDDKEERCDYVPCEEDADALANEDNTPYDGADAEDAEDEDVQEEDAGLYQESEETGQESIHDAIRNLEGDESDDGDWEGAIKQVMSGLAERIIYHAKEGNGGVIGDPDLADRWDLKTGIKDSVEDLLDPQTYGDLSAGFKKAFHRAKRDEESGRFDFSNDALLAKLKANEAHDDAPLSHPRPRETETDSLRDLGL